MLCKNRRDNIVYIPYPVKGAKINRYSINMIKILEERYYVSGEMAEPTDLLRILRTKAVFLNWIESSLDKKMKIQLILYRLCGTKVIWVFHNKYPHDLAVSDLIIKNMKWIAKNSSVIILHSKSSRRHIPDVAENTRKAVYVPHVLYDSRNANTDLGSLKMKYGITKENFVFTIFGSIKPYKNIEYGIAAFKSLHLENAKLLIAGDAADGNYARKINNLCKEDHNIILDLGYMPDPVLDGIIDISDVIVMPYKDGSSMNSGVMIQAFSKGKTVISPNICMAKDLFSKGFFYMYKSSLEKAMLKAYRNGKDINKKMGKEAWDYINKNNNKEIVKKKIYEVLK